MLLHFCIFLINPNIDLELDCIFGKPMNRRFQVYIVYTGILSTFHARIEYISVKQICHWNQWGLTPVPLGTWTPSNMPIPRLIPFTTPNDNSIDSHTSTQLSNKVPIGYNGMPKIHPKTDPSPLTFTTPSNTPIIRQTPLTIPNDIRIHSAILPQYTFWTDRPTHWHTYTHTDRQMG